MATCKYALLVDRELDVLKTVKRALCLLQVMFKMWLKNFQNLVSVSVVAQALKNQIRGRKINAGDALLEFTCLDKTVFAFRPGKYVEEFVQHLGTQSVVQLVGLEQTHLDQSRAVSLVALLGRFQRLCKNLVAEEAGANQHLSKKFANQV